MKRRKIYISVITTCIYLHLIIGIIGLCYTGETRNKSVKYSDKHIINDKITRVPV